MNTQYRKFGCGSPPRLDVGIKIEYIQAQMGTDEAGQPFRPKVGDYTNSVVVYESSGAIYIYDSLGNFVKLKEGMPIMEFKEFKEKMEKFVADTNTEISNRYTKAEADEKFATMEYTRSEMDNVNGVITNLSTTITENMNEVQRIKTDLTGKQDKLNSTNFKTINGETLLAEGNLELVTLAQMQAYVAEQIAAQHPADQPATEAGA